MHERDTSRGRAPGHSPPSRSLAPRGAHTLQSLSSSCNPCRGNEIERTIRQRLVQERERRSRRPQPHPHHHLSRSRPPSPTPPAPLATTARGTLGGPSDHTHYPNGHDYAFPSRK